MLRRPSFLSFSSALVLSPVGLSPIFFFLPIQSHRLVQHGRQRTRTATHTYISFLFLFLFLFPFLYIAKDTRAILELQEGRTAPEGSHMHATQGYEQNLQKACWQGRRQGSLEFSCRLVSNIYQLGSFIVYKDYIARHCIQNFAKTDCYSNICVRW